VIDDDKVNKEHLWLIPFHRGSHICRGLHGTSEPKIRGYASFLCSMCGGRHAVELPDEDDIGLAGHEGDVRDKRRFAHYLPEEDK
jgi:hypothetical protein